MLEADSFGGAGYLIAGGLVLGAVHGVLMLCSASGFLRVF